MTRIAYIGTFPPRRCGIAQFTADLYRSTGDLGQVHAMTRSEDDGMPRATAVASVIRDVVPSDYRTSARLIDATADVVSLQHEFGVFGGPDGELVLELLDGLRTPVVATMHTVLREPSAHQKMIVEAIARKAAALVVMSDTARSIMSEAYRVDTDIRIIPHGVPERRDLDRTQMKHDLGLGLRPVVLSFGLVGPGKGFEYAIDAMALVRDRVPGAAYVILGATHPDLLRHEGEAYRRSLEARIRDHGLESTVRFEDRFVGRRELGAWLAASDVFVTPYPNLEQIVSGTLAYALGAGRAVVATPYLYAREMLARGGGMSWFRPTRPRDWPTPCPRSCPTEPSKPNSRRRHSRWAMRCAGRGSASDTGSSSWRWHPPAAFAHHRACQSKSVPEPAPAGWPVRRHLERLRLNGVIAQHAVGSVPDPAHGMCTDDVARSIEVDLLHGTRIGWDSVDVSLTSSLGFLEDALVSDTGRFRNKRSIDGTWLDLGSDDAQGRAIAALGQVMARAGRAEHRGQAEALFVQALPQRPTPADLRPVASVALGCDAAADARLRDTALAAERACLARLEALVAPADGSSWPWPEPVVTYESQVVAQALIRGGNRLGRPSATRMGIAILDWYLEAAETEARMPGSLSFVGNDGWWSTDGRRARFDQQPVEASSTFLACEAAADVTGDRRYVDAMGRAHDWFLGANDLGIMVARPDEGACHDALTANGVNENQGAESTLAWLLVEARMAARAETAGVSAALGLRARP